MKTWPWLTKVIDSVLKEAVMLNNESNFEDIVDMALQMEFVEMAIMTSGMGHHEEFEEETKRIRKIRRELL
jgi:hypothetical protein